MLSEQRKPFQNKCIQASVEWKNKYLSASYLIQAQSSSPILSSFIPTTSLKEIKKMCVYRIVFNLDFFELLSSSKKEKLLYYNGTHQTTSTWISCTFGCIWRKFSISVGYIFSPPRITMSYKNVLYYTFTESMRLNKQNIIISQK